MGIYIKGMEMPKNGLYQIVDGTIRLYDYRKIIDDKEKDTQSYNIIEIKEPHGRLIDADELIEWAENEERIGISLCIDKAKDLETTLDDICPTVIEREVE